MKILIDTEELRILLDKIYNYDLICDLFQIPQEERTQPYIHKQVTERLKTYVTGYMGRRSMYERETKAAFDKPVVPPLPDPDFVGFEEGPINEQPKV